MKITGGFLKGRILKTSKNKKIRASSDKLREALFGILRDRILEAVFLDLFAGTGTAALEAYSRGAGFVACVDNNPEALLTLMRNIKSLGLVSEIKVVRSDVFKFLKNINYKKHDIIFMDPPYGEVSLINKALEKIAEKDILKPNGIIIAEHYHKSIPEEKIGNLTLFDSRKYGQTCVSFYKRS